MRAFSNTNLDTLKEELDKCDLLCANCHREEHNPGLIIDNISSELEGCNKSSFNNECGSICPVCGKRFPKSKGKIYCSKECREIDKHYPSLEEVEEQYEILKSWEKVAQHFGLTRRIIQGIRKRNSQFCKTIHVGMEKQSNRLDYLSFNVQQQVSSYLSDELWLVVTEFNNHAVERHAGNYQLRWLEHPLGEGHRFESDIIHIKI